MRNPDKQKESFSIDTAKIKDTLLNFIVPLVAFGTVVALFVLVILPSAKSLPTLKDELTQKEATRDLLMNKSKTLKKLVDFSNIVAENSDLINKVLVSEDAVLALQDQVYQMSINSGMEITKLSYSSGGIGTTTEGKYNSVTISVGAKGGYDQLIAYMELIENAARFVQVNNFRYSIGVKEDEGLFNVDLSIDSPYLEVSSEAVTDEPIALDISSDEFISFINRLKSLQYYTFTRVDPLPIPVIDENAELEEGVADEDPSLFPILEPVVDPTPPPSEETVPPAEPSVEPAQ